MGTGETSLTCILVVLLFFDMQNLPNELNTLVDSVLRSDKPMVSKWIDVLEALQAYNISYKQVLNPNQAVVHPCNMGWIGL